MPGGDGTNDNIDGTSITPNSSEPAAGTAAAAALRAAFGETRGAFGKGKEQEKTQDGGGGQPENLIEGGSLDLQQCLKEHRAMWFNVSAGGSDATIALLSMLKCEECRASLQGSTNSTACAQCGWALCKDCQEGTGASKRAKLVGGQEE